MALLALLARLWRRLAIDASDIRDEDHRPPALAGLDAVIAPHDPVGDDDSKTFGAGWSRRDLERALVTMPADVRDALLLTLVDGLDAGEASLLLGIAPRRLRQLLRDAVAHLADGP
jgi:DNA-directed RNA polymerase specialized sigma24 family protein